MVTNLDIIMGCLCNKTLPKLQNLMPMERKLNQMTCLKLYMVAIDNQKRKTRVKRLSKFGQSLKIHEDQLDVRNSTKMYAWLYEEIEFGYIKYEEDKLN